MKLSQEKYDELLEEYNRRTTIDRNQISKDIATARAFGDLSENAEYSAAKDEQRKNEGRIFELKTILDQAEIITNVSDKIVGIGTTVTVLDIAAKKESVYAIVSSLETDVLNSEIKKISDGSPKGQAFVGHAVGDEVIAKLPKGDTKYKIVKIEKTSK